MTDPHEQLKFKINNPLSRNRHRKPTTRGRMCSQNLLIISGNNVYDYGVKSDDIGDLVMLVQQNVGDQMIMSEFLLVLFSKMIPKTKIIFIPSEAIYPS